MYTASSMFTQIVEALAVHLRMEGLYVHVYLDNWLIRSGSLSQLKSSIPRVLDFLGHLGWIIIYKKSNISPTQSFEYLGLMFNTLFYSSGTSCRTYDLQVRREFKEPSKQSLGFPQESSLAPGNIQFHGRFHKSRSTLSTADSVRNGLPTHKHWSYNYQLLCKFLI